MHGYPGLQARFTSHGVSRPSGRAVTMTGNLAAAQAPVGSAAQRNLESETGNRLSVAPEHGYVLNGRRAASCTDRAAQRGYAPAAGQGIGCARTEPACTVPARAAAAPDCATNLRSTRGSCFARSTRQGILRGRAACAPARLRSAARPGPVMFGVACGTGATDTPGSACRRGPSRPGLVERPRPTS